VKCGVAWRRMQTPEGVAALVRAFETGSDKERSSVALALQQAQPDRIDTTFEQPDLRNQVRDFNRAWWPRRSIGKRSHERMVNAILLANSIADSVSTTDYLPARSVSFIAGG